MPDRGRERIALFVRDLRAGGAERAMITLAEGLSSHAAVDLVVASPAGEFRASIRGEVRLVDLGASRLRHAVPRLARYLREAQPAALLSALTHANLAALLARRLARVQTRVAISEHSHFTESTKHASPLARYLLHHVVRVAYPAADLIVAVSQGVADDLARVLRVRRERITTIHNPVVTRRTPMLLADPVNHPWLADTSGIPVIVAVGRLVPAKDYPTLLRGFARVLEDRSARLIIVGEGDCRTRLLAQIAGLGLAECVSLVGMVENPLPYMARADLMVLSSRWEGFGNVIVEALAAGIPIVSTDCPSGPAEILEGGRYGTLVEPGNPQALASAIVAALDAPYDPAAGILRANDFSADRIAEQYARLLLSPASEAPDALRS